MLVFRTYEVSDIAEYLAYLQEANHDNPDFVSVDQPDALAHLLVKAPAYRRLGHFLGVEGDRIVADAVAMARRIGGHAVGFVQWNALPDHRDAETFDGLLARCLAYLSGKASEARLILRPEHAAAGDIVAGRGFARVGSVARLVSSAARARSTRPVRALQMEDVEAVSAILSRAIEDEPLFTLVPIEGPFGMAVRREPASGAYFVAERDDRPVGAVGVGIRGEVGILDFLVVDPDYRRAGVGSSLLATGLFWMSQRGCARAFAVADPANDPAAELYRRFGFSPEEPEWRVVYERATEAGATGPSPDATPGPA